MNDRSPRHPNLVSAADTILVIIGCQQEATPLDVTVLYDQYAETVLGIVNAAQNFAIPVVAAVTRTEGYADAACDVIIDALDESDVIECPGLNPWENEAFRERTRNTGRSWLVVAGQPSEISVTFVVLSALAEGYEVYVVKDASIGASQRHHDTAIERMVQAGAVPVTSRQITFEWQRNAPIASGQSDNPAPDEQK